MSVGNQIVQDQCRQENGEKHDLHQEVICVLWLTFTVADPCVLIHHFATKEARALVFVCILWLLLVLLISD